MGSYRLSERAAAQIEAIFLYTVERFGAYQAEAYHSGFVRTFQLLVDFPLIGPSAENLAPQLRKFRFQSHSIFYTVEPDYILIKQILHVRVQLKTDIFE